MSAEIISGKEISDQIYSLLAGRIENLTQKFGRPPGLAVVLVGDNPASQVYVRMKTKKCAELGVFSEEIRLNADASHAEVMRHVQELNQRTDIDGILVQLPLPVQCNEPEILNAIAPEKDVDGFHPVNVGNMLIGEPTFLPCTPYGVWYMLKASGHSPEGKHVVIVGRSNIVGKPIFAILCQKRAYANATVTMCHSRTANLPEITRQADILIAAIGSPEFVKKNMVKPGAVVIDVGINRVDDPSSQRGYKLVGDVDFDEVREVASAITPVPGGVGPMTIAMLLCNTVYSFERRNNVNDHLRIL
ncbi:MAG: bifunctional methylenetetrahydrofolate dehydrogenase/methenyltetrahydrofolate cyclohydrolase FolD [Candidatus Auribacter fodinae]|jgi:methylenetetrahydrofolate dehydrogenase (NADP+)/methenyltetrahydrofolate cyclohydrolase|uniref:Bifunctional protein FolD n=1 Tax=Candidatus Auribacter fodinae TaxID=2093366 RepID=A0A3A4R487_9BACT|nr:MAG: bifunctional methylenetetrahydrofolate dehydrogenase/methenyltetrahydrofolate cyclohydrolase FolD [Candidatus Auribacter fodinae]